jgi:hypothetical protein
MMPNPDFLFALGAVLISIGISYVVTVFIFVLVDYVKTSRQKNIRNRVKNENTSSGGKLEQKS